MKTAFFICFTLICSAGAGLSQGAEGVAQAMRNAAAAYQQGVARQEQDRLETEARRDRNAEKLRQQDLELREILRPIEAPPPRTVVEEPVVQPREVYRREQNVSTPTLRGERFPETHNGVIGETYASKLNYNQLRYAINEIYARYGAPFKSKPEIRRQFAHFDWYHPNDSLSPDDIDSQMTSVERTNIITLAKYRNQAKP